jgi:hypothetical protein
MIRLSLDELTPGMRVAEKVLNSQSVLLLKAGTELTVRNIRTLRTWGVANVFIEGSGVRDGVGNTTTRPGAAEMVEDKLKDKFSNMADDPVMAEIMRVAGSQIMKRES